MIIAGTLRGSADPRREKPSLFFILCDELGWRDSRCFVSTFHETLNIDLATLSLSICWWLHPRLDLGPGVFDFRLEPGSLDQASGRLPHPAGGWIEIQWSHGRQAIEYSCRSPSALELRRSGEPPLRLAAGQAATWSISSR
jgi:hypothetical protein